MEEKARVYHEKGCNDCLKFVGAGNMVNLEIHSIDHFRDAEIAKLEEEAKAKVVKEARDEAEKQVLAKNERRLGVGGV